MLYLLENHRADSLFILMLFLHNRFAKIFHDIIPFGAFGECNSCTVRIPFSHPRTKKL